MGRFIRPYIKVVMALFNDVANKVNASVASLANPMALVGSAIGSVGSIITNERRMSFERQEADKQRLWNEKMAEQQNQWNLEQWNRANEYNTPAAQVARLREAGLNPMYYGVDGVAAQPMMAAGPLGYDRASVPNLENPLADIASTFMQAKSLAKDIEVKNAQIDKLKADTVGVGLDNEWKDKTMDARTESENLKNSLTKVQIGEISDRRNQIAEDIKKTIAETNNEILKGFLIDAQTKVANAQASEIAALLPFKQMLMLAQTEAQKAAACASFLNASINQKLIDGGAIDAQIDKAKADANDAAARAALDQFKASIHTGTYFVEDTGNWLFNSGASFLNSLFAAVSGLGEVIVGPISGIFKGL